MFSVVCGPEHVGFGFCRRERRYVALVHRSKCLSMHNPEMVFAAVCRMLRTTATVRDLYLARQDEVREEARMLGQLCMSGASSTVAGAAVSGAAGAAPAIGARSAGSLLCL